MKFLVIVTPRQIPMPPNVIAQLLSAQKEWLNERLDDATADAIYGFIGGGGCGIVNADSHEQMHALIVGSPAFPIVDYEVKAIADVNQTIDAGVAALRRAANMMPGPPG
jgi:muconolactone delta-isomerase